MSERTDGSTRPATGGSAIAATSEGRDDKSAEFIRGFQFAIECLQHRHGVGTPPEAHEYLQRFAEHHGMINGMTLMDYARCTCTRARSALSKARGTE